MLQDRQVGFGPGRRLGELGDAGRFIQASAVDHPGPHEYPPHSHPRAQLVYASAGVMTVATDRGTWVVPPQQAVWVPCGVTHAVASGGGLAMRTLYVHPSATAGLPEDCCVISVSPLLRELILRAVTFDPDHPASPAEQRILRLILDELAALPAEPLHLPRPAEPRLRLVTDALSADPADDRALAGWAQMAGASERTLARLFLRETGLTFGAWRQRLRLLTAIARLGEGEAVTTVAYDLGYESPSAFIAMFRRTLGTSPGRYVRLAAAAQGKALDKADARG